MSTTGCSDAGHETASSPDTGPTRWQASGGGILEKTHILTACSRYKFGYSQTGLNLSTIFPLACDAGGRGPVIRAEFDKESLG